MSKIIKLCVFLTILYGCNEFYLKKYSKNNSMIENLGIDVGYLTNNNKPNGLPSRSLLVQFNNLEYYDSVLSIQSDNYGSIQKYHYKYDIIGRKGFIYLKELNESNGEIMKKIKTDTVRIKFQKDNKIKFILFYN